MLLQRVMSSPLRAAWRRQGLCAARTTAPPLRQVANAAGTGAGGQAPAAPKEEASTSGPAPYVAPYGSKPKPQQYVKFCRMCGGGVELRIPAGDSEWRHVCGSCGYIDYHNPKLVVGCIVEHEGKILLCRRGIDPCKGKWTLPAGFLELGESTAAGAARETWEEATAPVQVLGPYAHLDIPSIGQTYILFLAKLAPPFTYAAGSETLEVSWCRPSDVPFHELAFSSISITLRLLLKDIQSESGTFSYHHAVIDKTPGSAPNDPRAYQLRDHICVHTSMPVPASMRQPQMRGAHTGDSKSN